MKERGTFRSPTLCALRGIIDHADEVPSYAVTKARQLEGASRDAHVAPSAPGSATCAAPTPARRSTRTATARGARLHGGVGHDAAGGDARCHGERRRVAAHRRTSGRSSRGRWPTWCCTTPTRCRTSAAVRRPRTVWRTGAGWRGGVAMKLLVIGGTRSSAARPCEDAVTRGHDVTVFHRGPRNPRSCRRSSMCTGTGTAGSARCRAAPGTWRSTRARTCRGRCGRSSRRSATPSVTTGSCPRCRCTPDGTANGDEVAGASEPPFIRYGGDHRRDVRPAEGACEQEALAGFAGRCLIVRPGYIVGPARPLGSVHLLGAARRRGRPDAGARAPVPAVAGGRRAGPGRVHGGSSGGSDERRLRRGGAARAAHVGRGAARARPRGRSRTRLTWVGESFLRAQLGDGVFETLPLWDVDYPGLHRFDVRKAVSAGLRHRPFAETVADTLAWDRDDRGAQGRPQPEREAELIAAWRATEAAT